MTSRLGVPLLRFVAVSRCKEFAERSSKRVILINGSELARYMINHNVGVSIEKTYEIKRVDSNYFAEDTENS